MSYDSTPTSTSDPSSGQPPISTPSSSQAPTSDPSSGQIPTSTPSSSQAPTSDPSSGQAPTSTPSSGQTPTSTSDPSSGQTLASTSDPSLGQTPFSTLSSGPTPSSSPTSTPPSGSTSPQSSHKLCPCDCSWNAGAVYTDAEVQVMVDKITKELTVPKQNLSSVIRAKISAEDSRQSAVSTGVVGLVLTGLVGGVIFYLDVMPLLAYLRSPNSFPGIAKE
ncbi:skin secretory protein xP2-like [Elysia marginata]|uniref:Skin secretory protein xP2-like n=1 Tax=Elysia marginata TaxID=1093978 RepID=A0AAV4FC05_9GAST|nr:skin secretory protein xP2-like [Elysia marginata]